MTRESDWQWLRRILTDHATDRGAPFYLSTTTILAKSIAERGVGLTVHSRAADLRRWQRRTGDPYRVECIRMNRGPGGRATYGYRLVAADAYTPRRAVAA